uniref:CRAL-TRIO domain-containing protein n=1 Tax=Timema tahoe TaxID=61484 RepID=A0A7R9P1F9_9NEOP|nr:unnamed protein product [Timema tahoe]
MDTQLSFTGKELDVLRFLGLGEDNVREAVSYLKDWIRLQPHLPECSVSETKMLWRIWLLRKMSLERTKQTVDMYYTVRNLIPEFFRNRDPVILQEQQFFKHLQFVPLPALLDDFTQVVIDRFVGTEDKHFELIQFMKISIMIGDLLVSNARSLGFHVVVDLSNYSLGVIRQFTPVILKKMQVIITKAYPVRIKSIHFVNSPVFVDKLVTLVKMVLITKLSKRIIVHTSGLGSLHDHISPKYLPLEYGGELGPVQDIWDSWTKDLISKRDWFLEQENISSDEKKRPGKPLDQSELFGMEGSFKKLSVD